MTRKLILALLFAFSTASSLFAEVEFSDLTINGEDELLFQASSAVPLYGEFSTAFLADIETGDMTQLSYFPESLLLINGTQLQIQNRYGIFRTNDQFEQIAALASAPSFVNGAEVQIGKLNLIQASPDGKFLVYLKETSPAYGDLILINTSDESETVISTSVELDLSGPPVAWSPNSDFFIYEKNYELYYYSLDQLQQNRLLSEEFRQLGDGQLNNIVWGSNNELYYLSGSLVYQILGVELFTRSLYQEFLKIGRIVGKIPFVFDPNFDEFWISPDSTQLLLNKGGRNLFVYLMQNNDFIDTGSTIELPYLYLPRNSEVDQVVWSSAGLITVLTKGIENGARTSSLYQLNLTGQTSDFSFTKLQDTEVQEMVYNDGENQIILVRDDSVTMKRYDNWQTIKTISHPQPVKALIVNENELIIAGRYYATLENIQTGSSRFLFFSQSESVGFSAQDGAIVLTSGNTTKQYDPENKRWFDTQSTALAESQVATGNYRVYLERQSSGSYNNMIMVRQIRSIGTTSLFDPPVRRYEAFPNREDDISFTVFRNGSRIRSRQISLVFNAVDSVEGLTGILNTLNDYDIQATFFINGDFIRRHPGAVTEIANSPHEVGSLFNVYFDMADARFQITSDFIIQGLAENEDEYFQATGQELSLLWHAPFYYVSPEIIEASQAMNYTYVSRDVDSLDWAPKRDDNGTSRLYFPTAELIERVLGQKQPGSIIAMRVGRPGDDTPLGGRDDYLFQKLDLLINNLIVAGYEIVPVSTLMDRAQ